MIVIFTEELSMSAALKGLMGRHFPHLTQGLDWFLIDFNGSFRLAQLDLQPAQKASLLPEHAYELQQPAFSR